MGGGSGVVGVTNVMQKEGGSSNRPRALPKALRDA